MWKCPRCGEQHEDVLHTCWKCGGEAASGKPRGLLDLLAEPSTRLALQEYLVLIGDVPLPTAEQRRNFVDYVATAHSWYKHLPPFLPGVPFYCFVDRAAGCNWLALPNGSRAMAERKAQGFHYSDIATCEYRTRFGFLSYSCAEGTTVFFPGHGAMPIPRDKVVAIPNEDGRPCCLPQPILDAGRAELTAVTHPGFADSPWWAKPSSPAQRTPWWDQPIAEALRTIYWPTESGGQMTLKRIIERVAEMRTPEGREERHERVANCLRRREGCPASQETIDESDNPFVDPVLRELVEPERLRQRTEMLKAIDRVCMLIHAAQQSAPDASG
jgi:hypothetical protein